MIFDATKDAKWRFEGYMIYSEPNDHVGQPTSLYDISRSTEWRLIASLVDIPYKTLPPGGSPQY